MSTDKQNLTPARVKALTWLNSDGSFRSNPGRLVAALNSLTLGFPGSAKMRWVNYGASGELVQQWRLTEAGQELKASLGATP